MKKYKVCVYAISKNEEKFVSRWVESMKEADKIYVLDTGSSDDTVKKLRELGVQVEEKKIDPWRFDVARNLSLAMVDENADICVCTDLDEVFVPGWRDKLEKAWKEGTDRLAYRYNWSFDENGKPAVHFYIEKIHRRHHYQWTHPVHEILTFDGKEEKKITADEIVLNHYPDVTKSRASYLPLLELSVQEDPEDDRNMHYLGREYMYYGQYEKAIETLKRHLSLKRATWRDERCASMRFIARCYKNLGKIEEAKDWLEKAMKEAPYLRDPFMERALLAYHLEDWEGVLLYTMKALKIKLHKESYINEVFSFNETPYDLLSLAFCDYGEYELAATACQKALAFNPKNERIKNNLAFIQKKIEKNRT